MPYPTKVKTALRVGCVRYLNALPFYHQLDRSLESSNINALFERAVPSELNRRIREGGLDIALISSLEYARHPDRYRILPGFCIGAGKFSESVLLISKVPLQDLEGKTVMLSEESLSSQVLLRILLKKMKIEADLKASSQNAEKMLVEGDACLLIGDGALKFDLPKGCHRYDLSSLWHDMTGLPFCFALWVVRRECAEDMPDSVREFLTSLADNFQSNMRDKAAVLSASPSFPKPGLLGYDRYFRYLSDLYFRWSGAMEAGLLKYYEYAREIGELKQMPALDYFSATGDTLQKGVPMGVDRK